MGVRIRKKWDLLSEQSVALAVLSTAFLLGGGLGCLFAALAGEDGRAELGSYLTVSYTHLTLPTICSV